jgi:NAD(P)-dependent dehydrogenase (short-subunit alcohol dehydrogenase family)
VKKAIEARAAMHRVCTPDDVAQAILALVTGSDLVTGQVLPVEGGMLLGS